MAKREISIKVFSAQGSLGEVGIMNGSKRYRLGIVLALLLLLVACNSGGNTNPPANTCPTPAVLDNPDCKLDSLTLGN